MWVPWPVGCCCFVDTRLVTSAGRKDRQEERILESDNENSRVVLFIPFFKATRTLKNRWALKSFVSYVCWSLQMQFRCTAVVLRADTDVLFRILHYSLVPYSELYSHSFPPSTLSVRILFFICLHVITRYYPVFVLYFTRKFPCNFFESHHWNSRNFYP
jgi:hypothetical protein